MDSTGDRQWLCQPGDEVYGADDHKLGKVTAVFPTHIVVEKGLLFHTDLYVPTSAINSRDGHTVFLNVSKDEALRRGWDLPPVESTIGDSARLSP